MSETAFTDSTSAKVSPIANNYSAKVDVSYKGFRLGSQYAYTRSLLGLSYTGSSVSYDRVSATYDEQVLAGYLEYDRTFGRAWSVNLGGRYEHTWTKGENKPIANESHTDYGKLFPSLRVGYNPSQSHAFSWSLSSRITRPNIINLNPNKVWRDVNHESYGNQNLKPVRLFQPSLMNWSMVRLVAWSRKARSWLTNSTALGLCAKNSSNH